MQAERLGDATHVLGEGPVWDPAAQALWFVDITPGKVIRRDWATGAVRSYDIGERVGCMALRERGGAVLATQTGFAFLDTGTGAVTPGPRHQDGPAMRFNDGKCDRQGRFWAGTMRVAERAAVGHMYRLDPDGTCTRKFGGLSVPNGTCFSPDGRTMYFVDTPTLAMQVCEYDPDTGEIGGQRVFATMQGGGHPDGATVDSQGFVWWAEYHGGQVTRFDPDGRVERRVKVPGAKQITCCAFCGPELKTLVITSASQGLDAAGLKEQPNAGGLFVVETDVRGLPEPRYAG